VRYLALLASSLSPMIAQADTIPCTHRYVETKLRELFNYVQTKPEVNTGARALKLEQAKEVRQGRLIEQNLFIRYCEGYLRIDQDTVLKIYFRVASREDYKRDRAEDIQACWNDKKFGQVHPIDQSLGCSAAQ